MTGVVEVIRAVGEIGPSAAVAIVGLAACIAVPVSIKKWNRRTERLKMLELERNIQLTNLQNGTLQLAKEARRAGLGEY